MQNNKIEQFGLIHVSLFPDFIYVEASNMSELLCDATKQFVVKH